MEKEHLIAKIGQYALISNLNNNLLVLERSNSKTWCLPGGRLNNDETWDASLTRELKEETGLVCVNPKPFAVNVLEDPYQVKYCVYFTINAENIESLKISEEHSGYRWINENDVAELDFEDDKVRGVAIKYLS